MIKAYDSGNNHAVATPPEPGPPGPNERKGATGGSGPGTGAVDRYQENDNFQTVDTFTWIKTPVSGPFDLPGGSDNVQGTLTYAQQPPGAGTSQVSSSGGSAPAGASVVTLTYMAEDAHVVFPPAGNSDEPPFNSSGGPTCAFVGIATYTPGT
jgi:hypothetical protein